MLCELRVKNFSLVEDVSLEIEKGFSVFTGETGAGKSLLLDAITLLLGAKASSEVVRSGAHSAEVEGVFILENEPKRLEKLRESGFEVEADEGFRLLVRREISSQENSKNRIWIQGKNATRSQLQSFLGDWVEVSGQHEFLRLNQEGYILKIIDQFGNLKDQVKDYRKVFDRYSQIENQLQLLVSEDKNKTARIDFLDFQIQELKNDQPSGEEFWILKNYPNFDFENRKSPWAAVLESLDEKHFSGLQIAHDPGAPIYWLGCLGMLIGTFYALFVQHKRYHLRFENGEILLSGTIHRLPLTFEKDLIKLATRLRLASKGQVNG